jgi:lysophospholipase L1-like esterase
VAYSFDQVFAADPANTSNVARNAAITIFAPGDGAQTPLAITDTSGGALSNPLTVNANGFGSAFQHATLDRVAWAGGGFTGYFTSYEGIKNEAVAAREAAETAAATAGADAAAAATEAIGAANIDAEAAASAAVSAAADASASAAAAIDAAALVGAPADDAIAAAVNGTGATKTALTASFALKGEALLDVDTLTTWGDSLTASQGATAGNEWPTVAGSILGLPVVNNGRAGWASTDIAALMGAVDLALTVTGNTIPASGPVTVTAVSPTKSFRKSSGANPTWVGTLAGVPGTLTHVQAGDTWTFTRTSSGTATPCPAGTKFHATLGDTARNNIATIWVGRNNFLDSNDPYDVVKDTDLMVRHLTSRSQRYLVIGLTNSTAEPTGSTNHKTIVKINALLEKRHGDKFVDIREHLVQHGMDEAGLLPTAASEASRTADTIPAALMTDAVHMNNTGYAVVAKKIARVMAGLGWAAGAIPSADPADIPYLGVDDVLARYYAPTITAEPDTAITAWTDLTGAHNLGFPEGTPTLRETSGKKYIDLGVSATNALSSTGWDSPDTAFTLAVTLKWTAPDTTTQRFVASSGTSGIIQINSSGVLGLWSGASPTLNAGSATTPGWHTVIAVFNGASSAIYVDGTLLVAGTVGTASLSSSLNIRGTSTTKTGIADFAMINHAVTAGEAATIHAALAQSIPA